MNERIIGVENARIIFRNFSGEERKFNPKGNRNFNLVLDADQVEMFEREGFKVRVRPPKDEYSDPQYLLQVTVSFKLRAPKVYLITRKNKTLLDEETIGELDHNDLENIDLTIRPYHWSMPNKTSGVKAYLNSLYATLLEDEFERKYRDSPCENDGYEEAPNS